MNAKMSCLLSEGNFAGLGGLIKAKVCGRYVSTLGNGCGARDAKRGIK